MYLNKRYSFLTGRAKKRIGGDANSEPEYEVRNDVDKFDYAAVTNKNIQPIVDNYKTNSAKYNIDDYLYRVQKLHPEISREQVKEAYDNVPVIASNSNKSSLSGSYDAGSKNDENYGHRIMLYNLGNKRVNNKNINDIAGDTLAHEVNHLYLDRLLGHKSTEEEQNLLWDAYNPFVFDTPSGLSQEQMTNMVEERATNAGLRHAISRKYGNATGADLDSAIYSISDDELANLYFSQNGYVNKDGRKHFKPAAVRKALKLVASNESSPQPFYGGVSRRRLESRGISIV